MDTNHQHHFSHQLQHAEHEQMLYSTQPFETVYPSNHSITNQQDATYTNVFHPWPNPSSPQTMNHQPQTNMIFNHNPTKLDFGDSNGLVCSHQDPVNLWRQAHNTTTNNNNNNDNNHDNMHHQQSPFEHAPTMAYPSYYQANGNSNFEPNYITYYGTNGDLTINNHFHQAPSEHHNHNPNTDNEQHNQQTHNATTTTYYNQYQHHAKSPVSQSTSTNPVNNQQRYRSMSQAGQPPPSTYRYPDEALNASEPVYSDPPIISGELGLLHAPPSNHFHVNRPSRQAMQIYNHNSFHLQSNSDHFSRSPNFSLDSNHNNINNHDDNVKTYHSRHSTLGYTNSHATSSSVSMSTPDDRHESQSVVGLEPSISTNDTSVCSGASTSDVNSSDEDHGSEAANNQASTRTKNIYRERPIDKKCKLDKRINEGLKKSLSLKTRALTASRNQAATTANKINICNICGRNYARPSTLKTHLRTHTNERPFRCEVCQKTFSQAANLTAHQRVHTGERPFSCPLCGRQFSQSSSVITHLRTHSGERPYRCNICDRTFSDSSTLTKHCRIHSGEKPYQCNYCPLNFSQSGNLSRHLKLHFISATPTTIHNNNNNSISSLSPTIGCSSSFVMSSSYQIATAAAATNKKRSMKTAKNHNNNAINEDSSGSIIT